MDNSFASIKGIAISSRFEAARRGMRATVDRYGATSAAVLAVLAVLWVLCPACSKDENDCRDCNDAGPDAGPGDEAVWVSAGDTHTCAVIDGGDVKCWGDQQWGELGYGLDLDSLPGADLSLPSTSPFVNVGDPVAEILAGSAYTCALTEQKSLRCWGWGSGGTLGVDVIDPSGTIGLNDVPADYAPIDFGIAIQDFAVGGTATCVLLEGGNIVCFGTSQHGQLGYGGVALGYNVNAPPNSDAVDLGGPAIQVSTGLDHTCAVLENGDVLCWGLGALLGYGDTDDVGDDEVPADVGPVDLGGPAVQVSCGDYHTCALLETGDVVCWGLGDYGMLGYGNTDSIGMTNVPANVGPVDVGGKVVQVAAGTRFTCALLKTGDVKCWGIGSPALGYGNLENIGDDEVPADVAPVDVGGVVKQITTGMGHTCALLVSGKIVCWGDASNGRLGYGSSGDIGDDETPASVGPVQLF